MPSVAVEGILAMGVFAWLCNTGCESRFALGTRGFEMRDMLSNIVRGFFSFSFFFFKKKRVVYLDFLRQVFADG